MPSIPMSCSSIGERDENFYIRGSLSVFSALEFMFDIGTD